jgi:hypothetical protein
MNELSMTSPISFARTMLLLYVPLLPRRRIFCYLPKYVLITEQIKSNRFLLFLIFIPPAIIQGVMYSQVLFVKRHRHNSFLILFYGDLLANDRITNISIASVQYSNPTTRFFSITRKHALFIYEVSSHTVRYVSIMLLP